MLKKTRPREFNFQADDAELLRTKQDEFARAIARAVTDWELAK